MPDGDDLAGIIDLRKNSNARKHSKDRQRPKTAGPAGKRERAKAGIITERSLCTPTRNNSVMREVRREQQYQAAIDKYRNYEYDRGPRVEKGSSEGVFRVFN